MSGEKIFYSIAEVAEKTELPKYVIRFWETEFAEITPDRRAGRRYYRQFDIDVILYVKDLLYKKGFTIKGAKKNLQEKKSANSSKIYFDFKMDETKKSLKPMQDAKILARVNFDVPYSNSSKINLKKIIQKLSDIEDILEE